MSKRKSIRPPDAPTLGTTYTDWRDFTNRVARPWVENDGKDAQVDAWYHTLMIEAEPWYVACALVIADNHIRRLEQQGRNP
jgi:hypothetical protein